MITVPMSCFFSALVAATPATVWMPLYVAVATTVVTGGFGLLGLMIRNHEQHRRDDYEAILREQRCMRRLVMGHIHTDQGVMAPIVEGG